MANPIGAEFSIGMSAIDSDSLPAELVKLSEQVRAAYEVALDAGRTEVASELRVMAEMVAVIIAKALRGTLEKVS